jgi:hypothetical protein
MPAHGLPASSLRAIREASLRLCSIQVIRRWPVDACEWRLKGLTEVPSLLLAVDAKVYAECGAFAFRT